MGVSLDWLAVHGKSPATVLSELGLRGTGEHEATFDSQENWGVTLPNGWYVVLAAWGSYFADELVERVTAGAEAVTGSLNETVMVSSASGWKDGQKLWSVLHDPEQGIEHIEAEGNLPPEFASIHERLAAEQAEAASEESDEEDPFSGEVDVDHLFDVPIELAKALTGFRYDENVPSSGGTPFERLQR